MTDTDYSAFAQLLRQLAQRDRRKLQAGKGDEMIRVYFTALTSFSFDHIRRVGETWLGTARRFPSLDEWRAALMKPCSAPDPPSAKPPRSDVRTLSADEATAYRWAEHLRYEGAPCQCAPCQAAGVTELPVRFVPTLTRDGDEDRAYCPLKRQIVVAGHWAHGAELARYYAGRDHFFKLAPTRVLQALRVKMAKVEFTAPAEATKETA